MAYIFSEITDSSSKKETSYFSVARITPWLVRTPIEDPVLLIASIAYSICCKRPSGVKVVVFESYRLDIFEKVLNLIM
jgi:hypothetical protein